ncbi:hypothetical protein DFH28DRAFT_1167670 [Melampsora americana]|nr:hypothetical protein DFH28DRAFT_1167670 [Melampsora americana]
MRQHPHSPRGYRRLYSMIIVHFLVTISFQVFAAFIVRRSPQEIDVYEIIQGVQSIKSKAEVTSPSNLLRLDHFQSVSSVSEPILRDPERLTKHTNEQDEKYDNFLGHAMIESWSRSLFQLRDQGLGGDLLIEAARFHGLMTGFPFWQANAAQRLSSLETAVRSIPSGWKKIHNAFASVVPPDHLTESEMLFDAIRERLSEDSLPEWWKDGKIVTSFDPVTECDLIFSWGDALSLHDQALDPNGNKDAMDTLLSIARQYYWKRTPEESYTTTFHGIRPIKFDFYNPAGLEVSESRINQLLGDPTTRTQPVRIQMKESQEGIRWSTNTLLLEWYLQGLNPQLMDKFGTFIEESAEHDSEFWVLNSHKLARDSAKPLIPSSRIKLKPEHMDHAVEEIRKWAFGRLPEEEVSRMKNWYQNALQLTTEEEANEVVSQMTSILKHHKEVAQKGQRPISNPYTSSRIQLRLLYESLFTNFVDFQNKLHWSGVKLDMRWIKTSVEFLGLSGQFPPLTINTVHLSNELESKFSKANQGWPTLIEVLKRWMKVDILNLGYRRYQNVLARLRDHDPMTYWWQQGTLESSLDPLFELEERLAWGDQLSLWIPDFDLSNLPDRPQRIKKLLSIAQSYASKVTETGELGHHSIYNIPPIKFTFTLKSHEEIANKRLETLLGSRQELMTSVTVDLQAQSHGNYWWSDRLALEWFTMRFNPQIIGPIGAELQKMGGSWTLHFDKIDKSVTLSHLLPSTSPDEKSAIKAFYAEAEKGNSISKPGKVKSLIRYWSDTFGRRARQDKTTQEPKLRFLEHLDSEKGALTLSKAKMHAGTMISPPTGEQQLRKSRISGSLETQSLFYGLDRKEQERQGFSPILAQLDALPSSIHQETPKPKKMGLVDPPNSGENAWEVAEASVHSESMSPLRPPDEQQNQKSIESKDDPNALEMRERFKPVIQDLKNFFRENPKASASSINEKTLDKNIQLSSTQRDKVTDLPLPAKANPDYSWNSDHDAITLTEPQAHTESTSLSRADEQQLQKSLEPAKYSNSFNEKETKEKVEDFISEPKQKFLDKHAGWSSSMDQKTSDPDIPSSSSTTDEQMDIPTLPDQIDSDSEIPPSAAVQIKPNMELPHIEMLYPDPSHNGNPSVILQRLKTFDPKDSMTDGIPTSPSVPSPRDRSLSDKEHVIRAWPIVSAVRRWWSKFIEWLKVTIQKPIRAGHHVRKGKYAPPS